MSNLPNFSAYQTIKELGNNLQGGRVVYLAKQINSGALVVIKQFQFAKSQTWSGFKQTERERDILRDLRHKGIPSYLDSFETDDGFCIVQEYKEAQPLSTPRSFNPDQVKDIAVQLLEILVYLQSRIPTVIHRDIKPENILVDGVLNVYLIDFGFARIGGGEVAMSSVAAGTFGFMAPEQIYNKGLTEATDLYGLGATLICLLTSTKSRNMDALSNEDGRISFKHLVPKLSLRFIEWLEKMTAPRLIDRYPNAENALKALKPLYVMRFPSLEVDKSSLEFKATTLGEKLTQTITLSNSIPETILEGRWEVEPHPNDPPHTPDSHSWISFSPKQFKDNQRECQIIVDTSKLIAQGRGTRNVLLHTNAVPEVYTFPISIVTAPLPLEVKKIPYLACGLSLATSIPFGSFIILVFSNASKWLGDGGLSFAWSFGWVLVSISGLIGGFIGILISGLIGAYNNNILRFLCVFSGAMMGASIGASQLTGNSTVIPSSVLFGSVASFWIWLFAVFVAIGSITSYLKIPEAERCHKNFLYTLLCFTIFFGISLGACLQTGLLSNPYLIYFFTKKMLLPISYNLLLTTLISGSLLVLTLGVALLVLPFQHRRSVANYRKREEHLIKP
jgi:serine/threonine protein kinase